MIVSAAPPPPLTAVEASIAAAAAVVMELLKRINLYFILYYSLYPNYVYLFMLPCMSLCPVESV